jgi:PAS domain S-box-containing protein
MTPVDVPFRALADFTYDWESWLDVSGRVRWVNPAITRLTGYSVDEALEMEDYPLSLIVPEDRPIMQGVLSRAREGQSGNHVEFRVLRKDGSVRWAAISWQPLHGEDGSELGVRTSVRDIDQHKQLERQLEAALHRAEAANLAKVEFLANVSHELRSPLTSILGYTELLRESSRDPKEQRFLATLAAQGRQLDRLVADLLDFSTLGAGSLPLRPAHVRANEVVREAVSALLPRAREKGLDLEQDLDGSPLVSLDPARLTQVVSNLVDNAIKYTDRGQITVRSRRDDDAQALIVTVEDTGPGLPGDVDLFQPFRQGRAATGGVGLGLAIAARLCHAMGGQLEALPKPANGALFRATFHAPLVGSDAEVAKTAGESSPTSAALAQDFPLDILIVDDVASAREFLADALRFLGYAPRTATSGEEAIRVAAERAPDVTFIDLQMPGRDGWSVARELRQLLGSAHVLVGASASHLLADSPSLAAAGFDAFLPKPTPLAALAELVLRVAKQRKSGVSLARVPSDPAEESPPTAADDLDLARLTELAELRGPDGTPLLLRTLERVLEELPALERCLAEAPRQKEELRRSVHDLAGVFGLLGAKDARARALKFEDELLLDSPPTARFEELSALTERLRRQVEARLRVLRST